MNRQTWGLVAFALLASGLALAGGWLLFTGFKPYDDEGYVLVTLADFLRGHRLYGEIFTQYGPFYYWWHEALHRLTGLEFTHSIGRLVTLGYWLGSAGLCAAIVAARRSPGWTMLTLATAFAHLWQMTAEPMHPGGLVTFLVALGAWAGALGIRQDRPRLVALAIGAIGAALALTKINVGVFFLTGAGAWLVLQLPAGRRSHTAKWLVAGAAAALPVALMNALREQAWVVTFAIVATGAIAATLTVTANTRSGLVLAHRTWLWLVAGFFAVGGLTVGATLATGVSLHELVDGVVLRPLRHPGVFFFAIAWRPGAGTAAMLSLALCLLAHARGWLQHERAIRSIAVFRLTLAGIVVVSLGGFFPLNSLGLVMSYGLSTVWLLAVPLRRDGESLRLTAVRTWLALLLVTQALHAYPVGGSQIGWGTFLWLPLLMLSAHEAALVLDPTPQLARWATWVTGVAAAGLLMVEAGVGWERWTASEPLRLPGAETLRLPELFSARLRMVTLNASVHAGRLFSLPGLYSFNLWTQRATPTHANATHWFSLLGSGQQTAIISALEADPQAMVITERDLLHFLQAAGLPVAGPLHAYLQREFTPAFASGGYVLSTRHGRSIAPLSTAQLFAAPAESGGEFQLQVCLLTDPGTRIAQVEWLDASAEGRPVTRLVLTADNSHATITPLSRAGSAMGEAQPAGFPLVPPRLARLSFQTTEKLDQLPRRTGLLRFRDPAGTVVAEAVFAD